MAKLTKNRKESISKFDRDVSASTAEKDLKIKSNNLEAAVEVGKKVAERALENGIKKVVFDRSGYKYHGRIKALADSARDAGLEF